MFVVYLPTCILTKIACHIMMHLNFRGLSSIYYAKIKCAINYHSREKLGVC